MWPRTRCVGLLCAWAAWAGAGGTAAVRAQEAAPASSASAAPGAGALDPFASPRGSAFYGGLGQPPLRGAALPPPGTFRLHLRSSVTRTTIGGRERFDGKLWEWARLELSLVPLEGLEVWCAARFCGWDERRDVFRVYGRDHPTLVIEGEQLKATQGNATQRHENISDVVLGAAWSPLHLGPLRAGLGLQVKSPGFRRADLTNDGTTGLAPFLLVSLDLGARVRLHLNGGPIIPLGETWIDEHDAFAARTFLAGAAGLTVTVTDWLSLGMSLEGSGVAYRRVPLLAHPPFTGSLGARLILGRFEAELGLGTGFTSHSADFLAWLEVGWRSDPLWGDAAPP